MLSIAKQFRLHGQPLSSERYGHGHINETYLVQTDAGEAYILQKLSSSAFHDVPALMRNVVAITRHVAQKDPTPRHSLTLVPTNTDEWYFVDDKDEYWRVYNYIADSICLQRADTLQDFYNSAVAFGRFQQQLSDFPAETLSETIPHFHDTPDRFAKLHAAIHADICGRVAGVQAEIDAALAHEGEAGTMVEMLREGRLPLRVTHNDTKLNNVMLDKTTRTPLCVIDLDTVMPGLVANDFGDSIRFGASTASEDETDLSKVTLSLPLYEAFAKGFLEECGNSLTQLEVETLPMGAKLMTLECGVRFLTDYLAGDVYFHIARPAHNLDRFRTQIKLVGEMEANWPEMQRIIQDQMKEAAQQ